jgi:NAD(P)-dependent dehydrogenase (short-subunit alcohol dehydrogenase family)
MSENRQIWFIAGILRGLGRELARAVLAQGDLVIGTTRTGTSDLPVERSRLPTDRHSQSGRRSTEAGRE